VGSRAVVDAVVKRSIKKQAKVNSFSSRMHIGKTLTSTKVGMKLYHRHTPNSVINSMSISLMWADRYLKCITIQL
jgi:uncharacterized membrane-anchored protein